MLSASATDEPPYFCTMRPADPFGDVIRPGDGFDTTRPGNALGNPGSEEAFSVGRATSPPSALAWQSTLGHRAVASLGLNTGGVTEPVEPSTPDPTAGAARRVGDAERDKAAEYLREHMAAGRLDAAEFDERLTRALSARWVLIWTPCSATSRIPGPARRWFRRNRSRRHRGSLSRRQPPVPS